MGVEFFEKPEIFEFLWSLLPGFVAAWVFHGFTPHKKSNQFERVIQALIFTAFIFPTVTVVRHWLFVAGSQMAHPWPWVDRRSFPLASVPIGILWGVVFSTLANTNILHHWLPDWITKKTSYPSEWYSALKEKRFVYLQLTGKRRIYGWPTEFPDHPDTGHFILEEAEWILPGNPPQRAPLPLTKKILIPAKKVIFVETEKRWDADKWKPKQLEPYSPAELATSVQLLGNLGQLKDTEAKSDEPKTGTV
jgi:Family of unknown function (DUF6338)